MDDKVYLSARRLAHEADTIDERSLARDAIRLSDRELDQAFASSTREAVMKPPPASGPMKAFVDRIATMRAKIADDQKQVDKLSKNAPSTDEIAAQLDLAKAQLALDKDELEDAQHLLQAARRHQLPPRPVHTGTIRVKKAPRP